VDNKQEVSDLNAAFFLTPKANVAFLYEDFTVRQALEKMHAHGYKAIPVLNRDQQYIGTITEGDFLWYLVHDEIESSEEFNFPPLEKMQLSDIMLSRPNPAMLITATTEELLQHAEQQNFVPIVDDRNVFIGIVTRKDIIRYFTHGESKLHKQTAE